MRILRAVVLAAVFVGMGRGTAGARQGFQDIVVRPGDTLWSISNRYLKDPKRWGEILSYNTLPTADPTVALPGMRLRVPVELVKERFRAAKLIELVNEVLHRKRETADWARAKRKMELFPEDGLRTMARSRAKVRFSAGEVLSLEGNSMVILSPPRKASDLRLLKGEVRTGKARVLTASALITPQTEDTSYSARVREDLTTLVQVYAGRAQVEAQGKKVELKAGFASKIALDKPPSAPIPLPELPTFAAGTNGTAADSAKVVLKGSRLSVRIPQTQAQRPATVVGGSNRPVSLGLPIRSYHVQIADDRTFANVVYDRKFAALQQIDLNAIRLPGGKMWWRVAFIDLLGFEGNYSEARRLNRGAALPAAQ